MILENEPLILYVDLFCGAGGFTSAVEDSFLGKRKMAKVIAAVNHDPYSIQSHKANHKNILHFNEDVRTLDLSVLVAHVNKWRMWFPKAKLALQAGLECTNFSKAKGGQSRDADSRTLAEHLYKYIEALNPDFILIENVSEFLDYGPLRIRCAGENGRYCKLKIEHKKGKDPAYVMEPIKHLKGTYYKPWRDHIKSYGYEYDHVILNCADYGLRTIRKRLFIQFTRPGLPLVWPKQTHNKNGTGGLKKHLPVRPLLELNDTGESMFAPTRKFKSGKSYVRVMKGGLLFIAGFKGKDAEVIMKQYLEHAKKGITTPVLQCMPIGETQFMVKYMSNTRHGVGASIMSIDKTMHTIAAQRTPELATAQFLVKHNNNRSGTVGGRSLNEPAYAATTIPTDNLGTAQFLTKRFTGNNGKSVNGGQSIDNPSNAITTVPNGNELVTAQRRFQPNFMFQYYSNGGDLQSLDGAAPAVVGKDQMHLAFLVHQFGKGGGQLASFDEAAHAVTSIPKSQIVSTWMYDDQFGNGGYSIDNPAVTIVASQNKKPLKTVQALYGEGFLRYPIDKKDCVEKIALKLFMLDMGIFDIMIRPLNIRELLRIQDFRSDYKLYGPENHKKKMIGNAVPKGIVKKIIYATLKELMKTREEHLYLLQAV